MTSATRLMTVEMVASSGGGSSLLLRFHLPQSFLHPHTESAHITSTCCIIFILSLFYHLSSCIHGVVWGIHSGPGWRCCWILQLYHLPLFFSPPSSSSHSLIRFFVCILSVAGRQIPGSFGKEREKERHALNREWSKRSNHFLSSYPFYPLLFTFR